jgi:hypothetical protein
MYLSLINVMFIKCTSYIIVLTVLGHCGSRHPAVRENGTHCEKC